MGGVVVRGDQIGRRAGKVTGLADGIDALITAGGHGEANLGEEGALAHVDARQIPEDGRRGEGVLELQDLVLVGLGRDLDADATPAGVDAPVLNVGAAGVQGHHLAHILADGPQVEFAVHVVHDGDTTARVSRGGRTADIEREGRGQSGQSTEREDLGEHHFFEGM